MMRSEFLHCISPVSRFVPLIPVPSRSNGGNKKASHVDKDMHLMESFEFNISYEMAFLVGFLKEYAKEPLKSQRRILPSLWLNESIFLLGTRKEIVLEGSVFIWTGILMFYKCWQLGRLNPVFNTSAVSSPLIFPIMLAAQHKGQP